MSATVTCSLNAIVHHDLSLEYALQENPMIFNADHYTTAICSVGKCIVTSSNPLSRTKAQFLALLVPQNDVACS